MSISSFASGAQAYQDKLERLQIVDTTSENRAVHHLHHRVTSQPNKQSKISSHYRGESFGNCLPLTSVATSSHVDSTSNDKEDSPSKIHAIAMAGLA